MDRINQLDETVYGTGFSGNSATLSKRVDTLYNSVEGSGTNISLREEMDALEYSYQNSINAGSLVDRVEKMERSVNGRIGSGSLQKRIISLKTKSIWQQCNAHKSSGYISWQPSFQSYIE